MERWYKVVTLRKEVREGRSFNPDEFAIHLEQVVAGTAPEDYRDPAKFFARTCFTRALTEHCAMVLRRLAGETANTAPVVTLVTQFGGGKTHTLTALYHLVTSGAATREMPGVASLLAAGNLPSPPRARAAVFVGNAWDPQEGRETPWIDLARQLAGDDGVALLGQEARTTPPGTEALGRLFAAAGGSVLILCDEVLNFANRHRKLIEPFHAFLQNLTVAVTGATGSAAVISLPRSQVEMTEWDQQWQDRITKVIRRVAKDLFANDEAEIAEVVRRRLFEDLGPEKARKEAGRAFADWCFEKRSELPPEWSAVDTATTEASAREHLRGRFEACYPFHPATLSVFQRKWQSLTQYQQTRGTLAMLAQWIALASVESFKQARSEPLITLGSAPLELPDFRSVVLGQIGESRLGTAIQVDVAGPQAHARALDADTKGPLKDLHRRVGTAIFFESSGGQTDKAAHWPELRFALGGPDIDTTSVDNAAMALEARSFYIRKVGRDGYKVHHKPTLKKVVSDRRASLDAESEVRPAMEKVVQAAFEQGRQVPLVPFPADGTEVPDSPRLTIVVAHPNWEWGADPALRAQIAEWTRKRGASDRLYPAALVWCFKKPGRELRERIEHWLSWRRVRQEIDQGLLGGDFEEAERRDAIASAKSAEDDARDEVWASYRYVVLMDRREADGLQVIDLGAGHASAAGSLTERLLTALRSQGLLEASVGSGYIDRNWPPAFETTGAWPLASLRKAFLDGSLTRLLDPDVVLKEKLPQFIERGELGLASGRQEAGYSRIWFQEPVDPAEIAFEPDVFLLRKKTAAALKAGGEERAAGVVVTPAPVEAATSAGDPVVLVGPEAGVVTLRVSGNLPSEAWNRLGTKLIPKLKGGKELKIRIELEASFDGRAAESARREVKQVLEDLGLDDRLTLE